jgi:DNA invertase Pin-like site-specific DNA recombinase
LATYGYARVSTEDQDCEIQVSALKAAGCAVVRQEKRSGTTTADRHELDTLLEFLREGDVLMVTRIDRLARSVRDLEEIVERIRSKGADLKATEQSINTGSPEGLAFLQMLGVFAQFETAMRRERQLEGIAKAKAAGVYTGRKATVPTDEVRRMAAAGIGPTQIAKQLGIGRASVYRALAAETA